MKRLHLVCNAHMDPMWLWDWEEGAAAAIATFRTAADFCEEWDGFIFNHNEALLYEWTEEFDPALFKRIQRLVSQGKWHIMGGWYLQPDCNMPSGESFVRQTLIGHRYFREKFGAEPTTAVNFDSFGHTRGLVQVLKKSGYDSYLHTRPTPAECPLPGGDYVWSGYDGSEVICHRPATGHYNSPLGKAHEKVAAWIADNKDKSVGMVLWGVGNHGGGPSRTDLENLSRLADTCDDVDVFHSTPERYFAELDKDSLPRHEKDINPKWAGCYTSQMLVKQKHRLLENEYYMAEKMMAAAALQGYVKYPEDEFHEALRALLVTQFHDILPGTSVEPVEDSALRLLGHGREIVSRLKTRAFFALASGQQRAKDSEIPIMVYNPHPFPVKGIFECEFNLADFRWDGRFSNPTVFQNGSPLPTQAEKELHNFNADWRKRAVFAAELKPSQMNRFDCRLEVVPDKPKPQLRERDGLLVFEAPGIKAVINCKTGLVDKYCVDGFDYLMPEAFLPLVIRDSEDAWGSLARQFRDVEGTFALMSPEEGTRFSGVKEKLLPAVRVIEDGSVRTVIEALFRYGHSSICQTYKFSKESADLEVDLRVYWNEKDRMLKLSIPTAFEDGTYCGQVAYGIGALPDNGDEAVAQKWVAVVSQAAGRAFTCINDCQYGSDFKDGELRLSLLRSPAYAAYDLDEFVPSLASECVPTVLQDRFTPRIDQGVRCYRFWLKGGLTPQRLEHIDREALAHNEKPCILSMFPSGEGNPSGPAVTLSDAIIQLTAFKKAETLDDYIIRLFEPTGQERTTTLGIPPLGLLREIRLGKFEIKTLCLNTTTKTLTAVDLMER